MQVRVELGSGGCHIVSSAMMNHPSYPDVVECFREMPSNPVAVECLQGGYMVIIVSSVLWKIHLISDSWNVSEISRCRGMFPGVPCNPAVVKCLQGGLKGSSS